jgi:hypothetical protein
MYLYVENKGKNDKTNLACSETKCWRTMYIYKAHSLHKVQHTMSTGQYSSEGQASARKRP